MQYKVQYRVLYDSCCAHLIAQRSVDGPDYTVCDVADVRVVYNRGERKDEEREDERRNKKRGEEIGDEKKEKREERRVEWISSNMVDNLYDVVDDKSRIDDNYY